MGACPNAGGTSTMSRSATASAIVRGAILSFTISMNPPVSVRAEAGNRDQEMEHPAQVVQSARVPAHERLALFFREIDIGERSARVGPEPIAKRLVLLQSVEHHVRLVAAHATSHSRAARSTRPISP